MKTKTDIIHDIDVLIDREREHLAELGDTEPSKIVKTLTAAQALIINKRCCANCKSCFHLKLHDHALIGCIHSDQDGFICMAFSDERTAIWQKGLDPFTNYCEEYTPYERRSNP